MREHKKILILLVLLLLVSLTIACVGGNKTEKVRKKIKSYLYEKYGEEFVVDRIGARTSRGDKLYQARIYPKSIIGTSKEGDDYYYASATVEKLFLGRLGGVGDNYSYIKMNLGAEEYLTPKVKEIFGKKILLKVDSRIEIWGREEIIAKEYSNNEGTDAFIGYKESNFKEARQRVVEDPKHNKLLLELNLYVFDRIEDKAEKGERRKDIFEFVQYLKDEGLFEYLEMTVIFMDERVLANSYYKFSRKIYRSKLVEEEVQGKKVELPPLELREKISKELKREIKDMSKEALLTNIKRIKKSNLEFFKKGGLVYYNRQYAAWVMSIEMMKSDRRSTYEEKKRKGLLNRYDYNSIEDIILSKNKKYIYF